MSNEYRNNHYVPKWYQKRFILPNQVDKELYYLELKPRFFTDPRGVSHEIDPIKKQGVKFCFAEEDLYTRQFGESLSIDIERFFFGSIDTKGRRAIDYFANYKHPSINNDAFRDMMMYMSTQKLRTPKGLGWISEQFKLIDKNTVLNNMIKLRQLHCAIWTECVWLIADASNSETKFIVSDQPITIYNRECGPKNQKCRGYNDPDIRLQGSHTIFPLSSDKILILTNLSWVRNPYQSAKKLRPHPEFFRSAMFKYTDIQVQRYLTEQEVLEINFVIKKRALKYIAAGNKEWLFPEKHVSKSNWNTYGNGYLFMPDPRPVHAGGEIIIGHSDGTASSYDEYGRRPWQDDYNQETKTGSEFRTLESFKGEFARLFGPFRRGRTFQALKLDNERDSDELHQHYLSSEKKKSKNC